MSALIILIVLIVVSLLAVGLLSYLNYKQSFISETDRLNYLLYKKRKRIALMAKGFARLGVALKGQRLAFKSLGATLEETTKALEKLQEIHQPMLNNHFKIGIPHNTGEEIFF